MNYTACQSLAIKRLEHFLLDPNETFFGLSGAGGVGKTHLLNNTLFDVVDTVNTAAKVLGLPQRINNIQLTAMTHAAVELLPNAETFHSAMKINKDNDGAWVMNGNVGKGQLLVVDEASMLQREYVSMPVDAGGKVLFSYDAAQLPPVGEDTIPVEIFLKSNRLDLVSPVRQAATTPLSVSSVIDNDELVADRTVMEGYFSSPIYSYALLSEMPWDMLIAEAQRLGIDYEGRSKIDVVREIFMGKGEVEAES